MQTNERKLDTGENKKINSNQTGSYTNTKIRDTTKTST